MGGTPHNLRRVVADKTGNTVGVVVEQTVFTYDGEDAQALVLDVAVQLDNTLQSSGRAWIDLPANAQPPTPGKPFPKAPPRKPS